MISDVTLDQMLARLSCEATLPQVPLAAMRLGELVDQELVSQEVLRVAASDPALTASLLRSASSPLYALSPRPVSDVRNALSILGVRGVKSVAMSVLMQAVVSGVNQSSLDPQRFVHHSTFVGIMAKYVFLRRRQMAAFQTGLNGDELFAAGVLHDLGKGLLAVSYPTVFDSLNRESQARGMTIESLFHEHFGEPLSILTLAAFKGWKLPEVFSQLVGGMYDLGTNPQELTACSALAYSDYLANASGHGEFQESIVVEPKAEVLELAALVPEEIPSAIAQVAAHTGSCMVKSRAA